MMRISEPTIGALSGVISGKGEIRGPERTSKPLINFFNRFGLRKPIVNMLPSKWDFTQECLTELNGTEQLKTCIEETLDYRLYDGFGISTIEEVVKYLTKFLSYDGYEIQRVGLKYVVSPCIQQKQHNQIVSLTPIEQLAQNFDYPHILEVIRGIENDIEDNPRRAIGAAKELVETVCKTILHDAGTPPDSKLDVQPLVKQTLKVLKLVPETIPNHAKGAEQVKNIVNSFSTITHNMAELRNLFGSGHGQDGKWVGLKPRHARLAVGAATALATFLFDTYQDQKTEMQNETPKAWNKQ